MMKAVGKVGWMEKIKKSHRESETPRRAIRPPGADERGEEQKIEKRVFEEGDSEEKVRES